MRFTTEREDKLIQDLCIEWESLVKRAEDLEWLVENGESMTLIDLVLMALVYQDETNYQRLVYELKERLLGWVEDSEYFAKEIDTAVAIYDEDSGIAIRGEL